MSQDVKVSSFFPFLFSNEMKFELLFLDAVDHSLGRLDYASLSQQALMEMVIEGITNKEKICGDADEPKDIEEWKGVKIEDGEVVAIYWVSCALKGPIHLEWLPSSVKELSVSENSLAGTLDWALPTSMKELDLTANKFTGPVDLERLPERMESVDVSYNKFDGSLKLWSLPDTLTEFHAFDNKFSGSVDLTRLPVGLVLLDVEINSLSGSVVLTELPNCLEELTLSNNEFTGCLDLTRLPSSISSLQLHNNSFSGTVDLSQLPRGLEHLDLSDNALSGEVFIPDVLFNSVNVENTKLIKRQMQ